MLPKPSLPTYELPPRHSKPESKCKSPTDPSKPKPNSPPTSPAPYLPPRKSKSKSPLDPSTLPPPFIPPPPRSARRRPHLQLPQSSDEASILSRGNARAPRHEASPTEASPTEASSATSSNQEEQDRDGYVQATLGRFSRGDSSDEVQIPLMGGEASGLQRDWEEWLERRREGGDLIGVGMVAAGGLCVAFVVWDGVLCICSVQFSALSIIPLSRELGLFIWCIIVHAHIVRVQWIQFLFFCQCWAVRRYLDRSRRSSGRAKTAPA